MIHEGSFFGWSSALKVPRLVWYVQADANALQLLVLLVQHQ